MIACRTESTVFVHGRGKRKSRNQRYFELFYGFLEHQTIYDWHAASFQGRNNYCKADPDATFMHMKDDHMRNAQLKPGYNEKTDTYTCHAGKILSPVFIKKQKSKIGYEAEVTVPYKWKVHLEF